MACIYKITNIVNGKFYIGSTGGTLKKRKSEHLSELRGNYHGNKHLQHSFNKNGEESFVFEEIVEVELDSKLPIDDNNTILRWIELQFVKELNPHYNIDRETLAGKLGRHLTPEQKEASRLRSTGRKHSNKSKERIRIARAKQVITEEHKRNISKGLKGKIRSKGRKQKECQKIKASLKLKENYHNSTGMFSKEIQEVRIAKMKEKYKTPEMRQKFKNIFRSLKIKPFYCIKNNIIIYEFNNQAEAAEILGFKKPWGISSVLTGIQKSHKGYIFKYKD